MCASECDEPRGCAQGKTGPSGSAFGPEASGGGGASRGPVPTNGNKKGDIAVEEGMEPLAH